MKPSFSKFCIAVYCAQIFVAASIRGAGGEESFPPIKLRGYGEVSGTFRETDSGSVLLISCESEEKAKLVQAKYLSDLKVIPGTAVRSVKPGRLQIGDSGEIAAWQDGNKVTILAAPSPEAMEDLIRSEKPNGFVGEQVTVPMFLDRWDKYGWRFYYRAQPWEAPKGIPPTGYDQMKDFDDAQKLNKSGFVFWGLFNNVNTAAGMRMEGPISWLIKAAEKRDLPHSINSGVEVAGVPTWMTNRFPKQVQQKMPQFCGNIHKVGDPYLGGRGVMSWTSDQMNDLALASAQASLRDFAKSQSLTSFLEPHGELRHGPQEVLLEYGPEADKSYREFLKIRYGTLEALNQSWFGDKKRISSWDKVTIPELASFAGWDERAIDLQGEWAVGYEELSDPGADLTRKKNDEFYQRKIPTQPAPKEWFAANFNDSSWPRLVAPGHDAAMLLPHRPAVFRREVELPAKLLESAPNWWLYVWDLNTGAGDKVEVFVNGKKAGEGLIEHGVPHWKAYAVAPFLHPGKNQFTLRLPKGFLGYRVYLSPHEPLQYPQLGPGKNAQWVDLVGWMDWSRARFVRRGMEMIRQIDPDRQITLMAPDYHADTVKELAEEYGGAFHNTGYMGVFYADYLPGLMQGSGLPFSVEPGEPARDLDEFKKMMGLYLTSNVNGVDYFIHIGRLLWNPPMRENFEQNLNLYHLMGKYHAPKGDVGILYSTSARTLTDFPWSNDPNANQKSGYFNWNIASPLRGSFNYDGLSESSFSDGAADKYRVIIDSNSSIMDEKLAAGIECWVRNGGIFITSGQTGRHTPTDFNAWPISALSGYKVARIDRYFPDGRQNEVHKLAAAPGQDIFDQAWDGVAANGLGLAKDSLDCQDLLLWEDGTTAVGYRRLGKGAVIHAGVNFGDARLPDRIEKEPNSAQIKKLRDLYSQILNWVKVPVSTSKILADMVFSRHYISNNGLYDVWIVWNGGKSPVIVDLPIGQDSAATSAYEVSTGDLLQTKVTESGHSIPKIHLAPLQSRGFLIPRNSIADAPREWFNLQRNWWRGIPASAGAPFPDPGSGWKSTLNLSNDWSFRPLAAGEDATSLAKASDESWEKMPLGIWTVDFPEAKQGLFRRSFRVPESWSDGDVALWIQNWIPPTFSERANVWLDGEMIETANSTGIAGRSFETLKPGTEHVLTIEVQGSSPQLGVLGGAWLSYYPRPSSTQDLAGDWLMSRDGLRFAKSPVKLPGKWDATIAKRTVKIDNKHKGQQVLLRCSGMANLTGAIINGRWIRQDHHPISKEWVLNITPWVQFGEENEICLGVMDGPDTGILNTVTLDFHEPESYP